MKSVDNASKAGERTPVILGPNAWEAGMVIYGITWSGHRVSWDGARVPSVRWGSRGDGMFLTSLHRALV